MVWLVISERSRTTSPGTWAATAGWGSRSRPAQSAKVRNQGAARGREAYHIGFHEGGGRRPLRLHFSNSKMAVEGRRRGGVERGGGGPGFCSSVCVRACGLLVSSGGHGPHRPRPVGGWDGALGRLMTQQDCELTGHQSPSRCIFLFFHSPHDYSLFISISTKKERK